MANFLIVTAMFMAAIFFEAFIIDPLFWKAGNDDKPISTYLRAVMMLSISFIAQYTLNDNYLLAAFLYGFTLYFGLFNYVVNWSLGKNWKYLGNDWFDRQINKIPLIFLVFLQIWLIVVGAMVYLKLNGTIEGNIYNIPKYVR